MVRRGVIVAALAVVAGCAPRLPVAPRGSHADDMPELVPFPPPPARVELIPPRPNQEAVWIDGTWMWTGGRYEWQPGGWAQPVPGATYAPANLVRRRNGELLYYRGVWRVPGRSGPER